MSAALRIHDLRVSFPGPRSTVSAVRGVDLEVQRGEVLGIVGESGSGKSVTILAAMGLLPESAQVSGSVRVGDTELRGASDRVLSQIRGKRIAMIFQDPLSAFTPVFRIGAQIAEAVLVHSRLSRAQAWERAVELLDLVGIPDPRARAQAYPHEFSGGMRQRAMIAMAIAHDPEVILADEPTTALDVTIQAQILEVLRTAQRESGAALVFVSHDLGVIAGIADRVAVMYGGRIVESAAATELFHHPLMPYTRGLIGAIPRIDRREATALVPIPGSPPTLRPDSVGCPFAPRCPLAIEVCRTEEPPLVEESGHSSACHRSAEIAVMSAEIIPTPSTDSGTTVPNSAAPVLRASGLVRTFGGRGRPGKRRQVFAVDGVDLEVRSGEVVGLVGESGSGKSTVLHQVLELAAPEKGSLEVLGTPMSAELGRKERAQLRRRVSMVFQDPMASLDPRLSIHDILAEPLRAQREPISLIRARVPELLDMVGLPRSAATRYPHEFSGGQRQRISIARAIAVHPSLLVLDEPVSALDVSVQAGILNLLGDLRTRLGIAYLLVSHDLSVIHHIADRVSVMYLGRTVETGSVQSIFAQPAHPYTRALLAAAPIPDPIAERSRERVLLHGDPPSPTVRQSGCRFRSRCPVFSELSAGNRERCESTVPVATVIAAEQEHSVACHFPLTVG